jgi:Archaeal fructose-1,6-bisphosphatase and related enzymes of inositol monophosphatase family
MPESNPAPTELFRWRDTALALSDEADAISMAGFRRDVRTDTKPDGSFVTEVDRSIEHLLRDRIRAAYPNCGLIGEEEGSDGAGASVCWYVDPIDATHNYMRGIPIFATLLAVAVDGEVQLGVVSAPALRERWVAWRGGGAWRGTDRIAVSRIATIAESKLLYGSRTADMQSGLMPGLDATLAAAWRERGFGDFWGYMLVAEGAAEAMIETGAHPWDWAAPLVIVEEAGGRFTTAAGERRIDGASAVATNGLIHSELLGRLQEMR